MTTLTVKFLYTTVKKLYIFCKICFYILLVFNDLKVWHGRCPAKRQCNYNPVKLWQRNRF
jgi:hypothetical protein